MSIFDIIGGLFGPRKPTVTPKAHAAAGPITPSAVAQPDQTQALMMATRQAVRDKLLAKYSRHYPPGQISASDEAEGLDGQKYVGKLLDYGSMVVMASNNGRYAIERSSLKRVEPSKRPAIQTKPDLPDLDVTYIERLPRTLSCHGQIDFPNGMPRLLLPEMPALYPAEGSTVTFVAHVVNKGTRRTEPFHYVWQFDGATIADGSHAALEPGQEAVIELRRPWVNGAHTIELAVLQTGNAPEVTLRNNNLCDRTDALGLLIHVTCESYADYNAVQNMADSFSFEAWVQTHFEVMNELFAQSIYPSTPDGCQQRVRVDKILLVNEASARAEVSLAQCDGASSGYHFQGAWQFARWDQYAWRMSNMDWGFIHEMGHQLGLIDEYHWFMNSERVRVKGDSGQFVNIEHGYSAAKSMMCQHGPYAFSEHAAAALNANLQRPRGFYGDYQYAMPDLTRLRVVGRDGQPVAGAQVSVYPQDAQSLVSDPPLAALTTAADGTCTLPNRPVEACCAPGGVALKPNPFGKINVVGQGGLMLLKVAWQGFCEWHWLELAELNIAAWRGQQQFVRDVKTQLPPLGLGIAPPSALRAVFISEHEVQLSANTVSGAVSYHLYGRSSRVGWGESPFMRLQTLVSPNLTLNVSTGPMFVALTAVDGHGRESGLSNVAYTQRMQGIGRLAIAPNGTRIICDTHPHTGRMVRQRADLSIDDWLVRPAQDMGGRYTGVAIFPNGQIIASNYLGSRLLLFNADGTMLQTVGGPGAADGQFTNPNGLALDEFSNIYVADTGNHRIQLFNAALRYEGQIGLGFKSPEAVAWLGAGQLAVADTGNARVCLLKQVGGQWQLQRELRPLRNPVDVARVGPHGDFAVADRDAGEVLVFDRDGQRKQVFAQLGPVCGVVWSPVAGLLASVPWQGVKILI